MNVRIMTIDVAEGFIGRIGFAAFTGGDDSWFVWFVSVVSRSIYIGVGIGVSLQLLLLL